MANSKHRPVQVDFIVAGVRKDDGTLLTSGWVVAIDPFATASQGTLVRKSIWTDADGTFEWNESKISLNANGCPTAPVYGDGTCDFLLFPTEPMNDADLLNSIGTRQRFFYGREVLSVTDFGAIGDGIAGNTLNANGTLYPVVGNSGDLSGTDNTDMFQDAIDYCLDPANNARPRKLFIPAGTYRITRPLRIWRTGTGAPAFTTFLPVSIEIVGEMRNVGASYSVIYADFVDAPAIMIQGGQGVTIRDLSIVGQNRVDITYANIAHLAVDPEKQAKSFSTMFKSDGNYLYDWALNWVNKGTTPSGAVKSKPRDVAQSPYAGVCIDPFHSQVNATVQYGIGNPGVFPNVRGLSIDRIKYAFNVAVTGSAAVVDQFYCEATASLGFIGSDTELGKGVFTFTGSQFDLSRTMPATGAHMSTFASVAFVGCTMWRPTAFA